MINRTLEAISNRLKEKSLSRIPFYLTSTFILVGLYLWLRTMFHVAELLYFSFTGNALNLGFLGDTKTISLQYVILTVPLLIIGWLLSTRVTFYRTKRMRNLVFLSTITYIIGTISWYGMSRIYIYVFPFLERSLLNSISSEVVDINGFILDLAVAQKQDLYFLLMCIPLIVVGFVSYFFLTKYHTYDRDLKEAFYEFEWNGRLLQKFSKLEEIEYSPDVELGRDIKTNEMVTLYGGDRTLNTNITGAIGTGKSAALAKPMIKQDLDHMAKFINEFKELYAREDYHSKHVSGQYLNGISILDPSNDLCRDVYQLAKAHNIPDEAITYIDPTNPDTPAINPMRGPVDKCAEVFAQVIAGLSSQQGGADFFAQAQRNHLKQYIYLLKEHDPDEEVTFDMLLDMYNNPQVAHEKHMMLKSRFPKDMSRTAFPNRDDYNYWQILKGVDEWFDLTLVPKTEGRGGDIMYDHTGLMVYTDAEAEYVKGLRNILNDIGANPLIRRVMFGKSEFDFDRHLEIGGILLVNTAKGELEELSRVLGKIVLMNLQNATFRRKPNISTYHHILVDEAPEYLYPAFKSFPAQSRKYKAIVTILEQTLAQLSDEYGENFKTILLAAMRNKMFYGDLTGQDAKEFSEISGERTSYTEGESEQVVSALQEDPSSRSGANYQKQIEQRYTSNQLIYQDAFACAVKIVVNNKPMPVRVIRANFVPDEEYEVAKVQVKDDALEYWLEIRREFAKRFNTKFEGPIKSIEETEEEEQELLEELGLLGIDNTEQVEPNTEVKYQRREEQQVSSTNNSEVKATSSDEIIQLMSGAPPEAEHSLEQVEPGVISNVSSLKDDETINNELGALVLDYHSKPAHAAERQTESGNKTYSDSVPTKEQDNELMKLFGGKTE